MKATNHVLTGAAIALIVKEPELAIPLSLASHFINDMFPHHHSRTVAAKTAKRMADVDTILAVTSIIIVAAVSNSVPDWLVLTCALAAIAPDLIWVWRYAHLRDMDKMFVEPLSSFSRWHLKIQWSETQKGIFVEIAWLALMIYLISHYR